VADKKGRGKVKKIRIDDKKTSDYDRYTPSSSANSDSLVVSVLFFASFFLFYNTHLIPSPISRRIVLPFLVLSYRLFCFLLFLLVLSCLLTCPNKKKRSENQTDRWGPAELNRLQYSYCTTQWGPLFFYYICYLNARDEKTIVIILNLCHSFTSSSLSSATSQLRTVDLHAAPLLQVQSPGRLVATTPRGSTRHFEHATHSTHSTHSSMSWSPKIFCSNT
jgi:hypothetical protein